MTVRLRLLEGSYNKYIIEKGQQKVDMQLVHARLADHYRDMELNFIAPQDFDILVEQLNEEARQRLALAVAGLDHDELKKALCVKTDRVEQIKRCFFNFAMETNLLRMELLRQSPLRVEEFARQFLARLGAEIEGETYAESQQRLARLDYRSLLKEAEQAKASAEERMDYLRQLREDQERRLGRRGKF
ncbi:hypothetical protein THIOM_004364 [Candidatus Thiomargarita nelsonii]|uniref:Uncharacterized protein n=1 Tax=Candidatus Thiomargarita nelsonii TaxID=1003181 RepID=A0A176RW25_9GAMM|nr:hypothetical protein THIOM_004364 [Candidatus Thiomargarita nelsonii]